jgi:hypothetical protein
MVFKVKYNIAIVRIYSTKGKYIILYLSEVLYHSLYVNIC